MFERMKKERPERYRVAGLGEWGQVSGLIYPNYEIREFDSEALKSFGGVEIFGLDFGYTNDPTALFCGIVNGSELYVFDEIYERGLTNDRLAEVIRARGYGRRRIIADSAEPKSIDELYNFGIRRISPSVKGRGSILSGIDAVKRYRIVISPVCKSFLSEIRSYVWETDGSGCAVNRPRGQNDHLMDAMRYAVSSIGTEKFSFC